MSKATRSAFGSGGGSRVPGATVAIVISLFSIVAGPAAAGRLCGSSISGSHPQREHKWPLRSGSKAAICRSHATDARLADRIAPSGAPEEPTAPLVLDGVMYFKPGTATGGANGERAVTLAANPGPRGAWELGVINPCKDLPRYY